jgi:hypothetical protein
MNDIHWYERFGNVPGMAYAGHPDIDRRRLPDHDAKPSVESFVFDGNTQRSLSWKTSDGSTSQSPAAGWRTEEEPRKIPSSRIFRRLYEALELPGTASDYHFAMLGAYESLWSRRKREPEILTELEKILLLDVSLFEAYGESIGHVVQGEKFVPRVPAFQYLITLYEREGFLHEALDIAKRAAKAGQDPSDEQRLTERIAEVQAEDEA